MINDKNVLKKINPIDKICFNHNLNNNNKNILF
jgi:hypothetical protein